MNKYELSIFERNLLINFERSKKQEALIEENLDKIEAKIHKTEVEGEEWELLDLKYNALVIKKQRINEIIEMAEYMPSETFEEDRFVIFKYGFEKNNQRYENDITYKGRFDLSVGFYEFLDTFNQLDTYLKRDSIKRYNKFLPYSLKSDDANKYVFLYKYGVMKLLKKEIPIEYATRILQFEFLSKIKEKRSF